MNDRKLIRQALDALEEGVCNHGVEQPAQQQEPLFWYRPCSNGMYEGPIHNAQIERIRKESGAWHPLYTSPPASKPLTDDEFISMVDSAGIAIDPGLAFEIKEMVEAAHGIKENT